MPFRMNYFCVRIDSIKISLLVICESIVRYNNCEGQVLVEVLLNFVIRDSDRDAIFVLVFRAEMFWNEKFFQSFANSKKMGHASKTQKSSF